MIIEALLSAFIATSAIDPLGEFGDEPPPITQEKDLTYEEVCSCIKTARALGVEIPPGTDASDIVPNSPISLGGLALFSYESADHVGVVSAILDESFVIREGNFDSCQYGERLVSFGDPRLKGFYNPKVIHRGQLSRH